MDICSCHTEEGLEGAQQRVLRSLPGVYKTFCLWYKCLSRATISAAWDSRILSWSPEYSWKSQVPSLISFWALLQCSPFWFSHFTMRRRLLSLDHKKKKYHHRDSGNFTHQPILSGKLKTGKRASRFVSSGVWAWAGNSLLDKWFEGNFVSKDKDLKDPTLACRCIWMGGKIDWTFQSKVTQRKRHSLSAGVSS